MNIQNRCSSCVSKAVLVALSGTMLPGCTAGSDVIDDARLTVISARDPVPADDTVSVFAYLTLATGDPAGKGVRVDFSVENGSLGERCVPVVMLRTDTVGTTRILLRSAPKPGVAVLHVRSGDAWVTETLTVDTTVIAKPPKCL